MTDNPEDVQPASQEPKPKANRKPKFPNEATKVRQLKRQITMRARGATITEIAAATRCPERTVRDRLKQFAPMFKDLANVADFKVCKADLLDAATLTFLKSAVTPGKLKKASVNNLAYAARQTFDMGRLERGQSTANIATRTFVDLPPSALVEAPPLHPELSNSRDIPVQIPDVPALPAPVGRTDDDVPPGDSDQGAGGSDADHSRAPTHACDEVPS